MPTSVGLTFQWRRNRGANLAGRRSRGVEWVNHSVLHTLQTVSSLRAEILVLCSPLLYPQVSRTVTDHMNQYLQRSGSAMMEKMGSQERQENGNHVRGVVRESVSEEAASEANPQHDEWAT